MAGSDDRGRRAGRGGDDASTGWWRRRVHGLRRWLQDRLWSADEKWAADRGYRAWRSPSGWAVDVRDPRFDLRHECPACHGTGHDPITGSDCPDCEATGVVTLRENGGEL